MALWGYSFSQGGRTRVSLPRKSGYDRSCASGATKITTEWGTGIGWAAWKLPLLWLLYFLLRCGDSFSERNVSRQVPHLWTQLQRKITTPVSSGQEQMKTDLEKLRCAPLVCCDGARSSIGIPISSYWQRNFFMVCSEMGYPHSWMVYFMEIPRKWMMTGGTAMYGTPHLDTNAGTTNRDITLLPNSSSKHMAFECVWPRSHISTSTISTKIDDLLTRSIFPVMLPTNYQPWTLERSQLSTTNESPNLNPTNQSHTSLAIQSMYLWKTCSIPQFKRFCPMWTVNSQLSQFSL